MHALLARIDAEGDADRPRDGLADEWGGRPPRVARIARAHGRQPQPHVAHAPRERALHGHQLRAGRTLLGRRLVVGGHAAERRPDAGDAAAVGRIADRAAEVVAVGQRRDAGGERGGGAAAAAPRRVRAMPRVEGAPAQLVVGVPAQAEGRRIGAADDDGARALPVRHRRAVALRDEILECRYAVGCGHAFLVDVLLDRHRHAVQRAQRVAAANGGVGAVGRREGLVGEQHGDGVQRGIDGGQPLEHGARRLVTRDAARADGGGELDGVPAPQVAFHGNLLACAGDLTPSL